MHQLTITDHTGSIRETETLLFKSRQGALAFATRKGDLCGMLHYTLNGKPVDPSGGDASFVEHPCGTQIVTRYGVETHLWEAAA